MNEEYPIDCEVCGDLITDFDDDFNGMCEDCYNTPPNNQPERYVNENPDLVDVTK